VTDTMMVSVEVEPSPFTL